MPKEKDLKRRVRARMDKTGEAYTTARAQLLRRKSLPIPDNYADLAGMSDDAVAAKTGRPWPEWVRALDDIGAMEMRHGDVAQWVYDETGLGWWSQMVTVGYERIRGLREVGQRLSGSYEASKSRTFNVSVTELYRAFADARRRKKWLDVAVKARATPEKSVRFDWPDGTRVQAWFVEKGPAKSSVSIAHAKLASKEAVDQAKREWAERLSALGELLGR